MQGDASTLGPDVHDVTRKGRRFDSDSRLRFHAKDKCHLAMSGRSRRRRGVRLEATPTAPGVLPGDPNRHIGSRVVDLPGARTELSFAPSYGQHTDAVLGEAGFGAEERRALRAAGVAA